MIIPLVTNFPEICAFIIGINFVDKNEALVCLLTDGVLADTILILPAHRYRPPIKRRWGPLKKVRKQVTEKPFTSI